MALTDYSIDTSGTPADVRRRQAYAEALMKAGGESTPIRSPWQGVNRLAQGLLGGYESGRLDRQDAEGQKAANAQFASFPGASGAMPAALASQAPLDGAAAASSIKPDTEGKIYSNDEPSPLDPPSGQDRQKMMATILGEAGNEPQLGKNAVASVIRTRAVDGGYGGDTPSGVVQSPNQFEPWNTPEGRARMASALSNPQQAAAADQAISSAYGEGGKAPEDPTEGMTHFYSPKGQTAMGRPAPAWAGGDSVTIGGHVFNSPDDKLPANAAVAQGALPTAGPQVAGGGGADVRAWALGVLQNPRSTPIQQQVAKEALTASQKQDTFTTETDPKTGDVYNVNKTTGQKTMLKAAEKDTATKRDYDSYVEDEKAAGRKPIPFGQFTGKVDAPASIVNNSGLSGQAFLDTLDPGRAEIIKQMTEGRMAPPTGAALRSDKVMSLMSDAARYDPEFDSTKWGARVAGSKDFASGKSAEMVRSAGQTVHHIDTLIGNMKDLSNTSVKPYNYLKNTANDAMGRAEPNNFMLTSHAVAEELSKVFKGANLSDSEVRTWEHSLSPNMSPDQQKGAIKSAMTLLNGSLHMLEEKRLNSMGKVAADKAGPLLKPEEQKAYDKAMSWANGDQPKEGEIPKLDVGQSHKDGDVTITKISH
jgi:spore germination cell wall hydrolase CwlJ-like protein